MGTRRTGATIETVGAGTVNLRERAGGKRAYLARVREEYLPSGKIRLYDYQSGLAALVDGNGNYVGGSEPIVRRWRGQTRAASAQTTNTGTIVTYRNTGTAAEVAAFAREWEEMNT